MKLDQLPYLLRLFDDDSPTVRAAVLAELSSLGSQLESALADLDTPLSAERREVLDAALREFRHGELRAPFEPGQLVRHRRYGYRGVVVESTPRCLAPDDWYEANETQPEREQPWYHVLVDGSTTTTYAAHSSLLLDDSADPVEHPSVSVFFKAFSDGRYERNDRPWPRIANAEDEV